MITITNGKEKFTIRNNELWERKEELQGKATKLKYQYWSVELLFTEKEKGHYDKIVKCYPSGDSYLEIYPNKDVSKKDEILLSNKDYKTVKKLWENMNIDNDIKKDVMLDAVARIFSYECYQNYILELDKRVSLNEIFRDCIHIGYPYRKYKKEIYKRAKLILKDIYGVENIIKN